jgi:CheY-like chemotaxis protein
MRTFDRLIVLLVEDDWLVREDMTLALQQEGWIVLGADTGVGALKLLRETNTIDLLITDIGLADAMTGWEVAEAVRASRPKIPVIYTSGNQDDDSRRVPESIFLAKPVTPRELTQTCHRLLLTSNN